jgi:hypothetical protein
MYWRCPVRVMSSGADLTRQGLEQRGEEGPVRGRKPHFARPELPQHSDLVAQGEDLGVLVAVAHRQQAEHGEGIGHGQIGEAKQHSRS